MRLPVQCYHSLSLLEGEIVTRSLLLVESHGSYPVYMLQLLKMEVRCYYRQFLTLLWFVNHYPGLALVECFGITPKVEFVAAQCIGYCVDSASSV